MSRALGGTRAPSPPSRRQWHSDPASGPRGQAPWLGGPPGLPPLPPPPPFLPAQPLPFIRPGFEVGTSRSARAPPLPQARTHLSHLNPGAGTRTSTRAGALGAGHRSQQRPVPLRLSGAAAACSRHPRRRSATPCSVPCCAQSLTLSRRNLLILSFLSYCPRLFPSLPPSLLVQVGVGEGGGILSPLTFQGTQFAPSLFPFQAASQVLPEPATPDPKRRAEPLPSRGLFFLLRFPPLPSSFFGLQDVGVDGGSGGSLSRSSASFSAPSLLLPPCHLVSGKELSRFGQLRRSCRSGAKRDE